MYVFQIVTVFNLLRDAVFQRGINLGQCVYNVRILDFAVSYHLLTSLSHDTAREPLFTTHDCYRLLDREDITCRHIHSLRVDIHLVSSAQSVSTGATDTSKAS